MMNVVHVGEFKLGNYFKGFEMVLLMLHTYGCWYIRKSAFAATAIPMDDLH